MTPIYLDSNSTTPLLPEVWEAMRPYALEVFANPASAHSAGRRARRALEDNRERRAALLGAHPDEVVFTSGATEANNLAVLSLAGDPPGELIASALEHPSVGEPVAHLAGNGFRHVDWPVSGEGVVRLDALTGLVRPETRLVALMLVNHETGAIQPVKESVGALGGVPLHCDAVQAVGKIPVDFHALGVATLSLSAHKFHGPRGVGALLMRRGVRLRPLTRGGHQQQGRRPGTEPVALVVGLVAALGMAVEAMEARAEKVRLLRRTMLAGIEGARPFVVTGEGLPSTLNVSFPGLRADSLLMSLDLAGVACSTGAACSSGSLLPSPVLRAMGVPEDVLRGALRFSFHAGVTEAEMAEAARRVVGVVTRLRRDG
jgi:cysteine desulfurase